MKRVGIYGGSFDPVHRGHLETARGVAQALSLDVLHFVPCGEHAFGKTPSASGDQRCAMLELGLKEQRLNQLTSLNVKWQVDPIELQRAGVSYAVDTCRDLRKTYGPKVMLCFVLGTDAFNSFHEWQNWQEIAETTNLILVERAKEDAEVNLAIHRGGIDCGESEFQALVPDPKVQYLLDNAVSKLTETSGQLIKLTLPPQPFSSSQVRRLLGSQPTQNNDEALSALQLAMPATVLEYIERHRLYQNL